jgi:hypothetical protein
MQNRQGWANQRRFSELRRGHPPKEHSGDSAATLSEELSPGPALRAWSF